MSKALCSRRPWFHGWRGRLLAVITGFAMLMVAELVCILFGWGRVTDYDDPFVGFSEIHPLFVRDIGGENYVVAPSRRKFFPPESFPVRKQPGSFRIFCLGGSTVQGNPYSKETSFTTWLELGLKAADPSRDWDVINCGGISYASYRLAPILQECLVYQPDLFILCTGHNEFLEDRTYHSIKHAPKLLAVPQQAVARLRIYTLLREAVNNALELRAVVGRVTPCAPQFVSDGSDGAHGVARPTLGLTREADGWPTPQAQRTPSQFSGKPVMKGEVDPWLDYNGGLKIYHRDPAWRQGVIAHFANNLRRMVAIARDAGVPVVLVQPPSNLRDCPPFKSEHRAGLTEEQERHWQALMAHADRQSENDPSQSAELLRRAIEIDNQFAATFYSLGKCYERIGEVALARDTFRMARELDVCPLRMLEPLECAMTTVATETGTPWLNAHQLLERESALGSLGDDLLLDHVHPSIHSHQMIAGALMDMMEQQGWVKPRAGWAARRDQMWQQHLASLGEDYFRAGEVALNGLRAWTQGRASGPPIEYRLLGGGLSALR